MRLSRLIVLAIALALVIAQPAAAIGPGRSGDHAPLYYLSLGDSLAAGQQPIGDPSDMHRTNEGYADQLYAMATAWYPNLRLVRLGCPGETTVTFVDGGICAYDRGTQLDEALNFLHAHGRFVAFITIDIGINDFPCQNDVGCVGGGLLTIGANLPDILAQLREAAGPETPIVGMNYYDPILGYWLTGASGQAIAVQSIAIFQYINGFLGTIYAAAQVPVADVMGAFETANVSPIALPPFGIVPTNVARICQWTWVCAPPPYGPNNHANATGYGVMAQAFATALAH